MSNGLDVRGRALQDGELAAWLAEHSLGNRFGLAVVGTDLGYGSKTVALAIVAADGDGRYIDVAALKPDDEAALASWLADPGPPKAVHEAKLAMHALAGCGWTLRGVTSDTALAAYLLRPQHRSLALNDLLVHHMRCALPAEAVEPQQLSSPKGQQPAVSALILRACAVLDLADALDEELARIDSSSLLSRRELPVQRVLAEMETAGVAVDRAMLTRIQGQASELLNSIGSDGRIHATFHQTSGELSSSNPNLHEIAAGRQIREAFVAGDGYAGLMTARYRQIEKRVTSIKGGATDIVKAAMIDVNQAIKDAGLKSRMLLPLADGLVFEVADGECATLAEYVCEHMDSAYPLDMPLEVSIGYGPNWDAAASAGPA